MAYVLEKKDRPGVLYFGWVDEDGKEHQNRSPYQPETEGPRALAKARALTQVHADDLEAEAKEIRDGLKPRKKEAPLFRDIAKRYEDEHAANLKSAPAIRGRIRNHLLPVFGEKRLTAIDVAALNTFLGERLSGAYSLRGATRKAGRKPRKLSAASVAHLRQILHAIFAKAVDEGVMPSNPVDKAMEVEPEERAPTPVSNVEAEIMLRAAPEEWRNFLATAFYTGMRRDELRRIRVRGVDLERRTITLDKTKSGGGRAVPIADDLVPYLRVQLSLSRSVWLFPNKQGGQLSRHIKTAKLFRKAMVKAGIVEGFDHVCRRKGCGHVERRADDADRPCPKCGFKLYIRAVAPTGARFHDARATFVTELFKVTGNLQLVSEVVGHKSGAKFTRDHYLLFNDEHRIAEVSRLSFGSGAPAGSPGIPGQLLDRAPVGGEAEPSSDVKTTIASVELRHMRAEGIEPSTYGLREKRAGVHRSLRDVAPSGGALQGVDSARDAGGGEVPGVAGGAQELRRVPGQLLDEAPRYMSADEAAVLLGIARASVFKLRDEGQFGCVRSGRSVLFPRAELEAYRKRRGKPRGRRSAGGRS